MRARRRIQPKTAKTHITIAPYAQSLPTGEPRRGRGHSPRTSLTGIEGRLLGIAFSINVCRGLTAAGGTGQAASAAAKLIWTHAQRRCAGRFQDRDVWKASKVKEEAQHPE